MMRMRTRSHFSSSTAGVLRGTRPIHYPWGYRPRHLLYRSSFFSPWLCPGFLYFSGKQYHTRVMTPAKFRALVWRYYRAQGRHDLPWRPPALKLRKDKTFDPYRVLVSEVMLQQTQVERVIPFYKDFIQKFPTAKKLAAAPLSEVLKAWQGLGYNRRAKLLHLASKEWPSIQFLTYSPENVSVIIETFEKLPGVGPYTANAVAAFAFNANVVFVETNIRTAVIHHFFNRARRRKGMIYHTSARKYSDAEIEKILIQVLPKGKSREWYSALMDYGAYLKRSCISHNAKSKAYVKQSKFSGSLREARGAILRELAKGPQKEARLAGLLGDDRTAQVRTALAALIAEHLVAKKRSGFALSD